jgi:hypothetical protein
MRYTKVKKQIIEGNLVQIMRDNSIKNGNPFYYMRNGKIKTNIEVEQDDN